MRRRPRRSTSRSPAPRELRLVVTDGGNGIAYDHGDWANARIECGRRPTRLRPRSRDRTPAPGATGVAVTVSPTRDLLRGDESRDPDHEHLHPRAQGQTTPVPATVSYASRSRRSIRARTWPRAPRYTATVKGGASGVKDVAGNALAADVSWSFTTGAAGGTATLLSQRPHLDSGRTATGRSRRTARTASRRAGTAVTLTLNGVTYAKGLGVHAASDVRYAISGELHRASRPRSGVDDEIGPTGSVVFEVYAGATKVYDSRRHDRGHRDQAGRRLDRRRRASCGSSSPTAATASPPTTATGRTRASSA